MTAIDLSFTWLMLLLLGIFHGINPGMGWLFAVGLGLQEQRRAAVWAALLPLALGHALAIGATILLVGLVGLAIPLHNLKWIVAAVLVGFGLYRLVRSGHPRYGGMQVGARDLTIWSFLMASAHGAGLMVLPFLFGTSAAPGADSHAAHDHGAMAMAEPASHVDHAAATLASLPGEPLVGLVVTAVHTLGYLLVMGLIAVVVYEKVGLRLLRAAWINLDLIWAGALILTGLLTLVL